MTNEVYTLSGQIGDKLYEEERACTNTIRFEAENE